MHDPDPGHPTAEQLRAFSHGQVEAAEQERVAAHLAGCAACCAALDDLTPRDARVTRLRDAVGEDQAGREADAARQSAVRALRRGHWREALTPRPPERTAPGSPATPLPDPPATPPAWQVGAYDLLGEVGRGGMGVVYKARHRELNRVVALKMVLAGEFASASQRLRFRREAELAARVRHAHIVQVYEVGQVGDRPYLAMEWVEGGTLADRLDGTPWPARPAAHLVGTLARAIDAAHRQGVIHRDLKPANILVQPAEEADSGGVRSGRDGAGPLGGLVPKITDFGLARTVQGQAGLTRTGFTVGTPEYMAPEQAGGDSGQVGPAVDVYALGVILYQLLTGRPPFRGESPAEVLRASASAPPIAPRRLEPRVPRDLETIALKALEKEPRTATGRPRRWRRTCGGSSPMSRSWRGRRRRWTTCASSPAGTRAWWAGCWASSPPCWWGPLFRSALPGVPSTTPGRPSPRSARRSSRRTAPGWPPRSRPCRRTTWPMPRTSSTRPRRTCAAGNGGTCTAGSTTARR